MMTRINLLPVEWRKKQMTPLATLLPALAILTLIVGASFFWGWLHFAELAKLESERDELSTTKNTLQGQLRYVQSLKGEQQEYRKREETIQLIRASRVPWTRKLDELWDVVVDDDNGRRFLVQLDELSVKPPRNAAVARRGRKKNPVGDTVVFKGVCFSSEDALKAYNIFHESVKQSEFFRADFLSINHPEGKAVDFDDGLVPSRGWEVDVELKMRARQAEKKKGSPRRVIAEGK